MNAKEFHIGDILTAMTGTLVSPDGVDGLYRILDHLTGEGLMTHQLVRASNEAEPILRERFPDLAAIEIPTFSFAPSAPIEERRATVMAWLDGAVETHGATRLVEPLDALDHTQIDPLAELTMIRPDAQIITIALGGEGQS